MIITEKLAPEHIPQLWTIDRAIWNHQNTPVLEQYEDYERYATSLTRQQLLLALDEATREVLGALSYHHPSPLPAHRRHWVLGIGIAPSAQGQGVGQTLIQRLLEMAPSRDIGKISLRVFETNPGARRFYQKLGFQEEGFLPREYWLDDQWVAEYIMAYYVD